MSSLVKVPSKDFPQLAKMAAGQAVTLVLKGRIGQTTLDGGQQMVELNVMSINSSKNGRMSSAQILEGVSAKVSKILSNVEQVNTPRP